MGRNQSEEEVEQEHLQAFGPKLGPLYHALHNEVTWLHAKWLEYRKLYAHSQERIDLLNGTAAFFFRVVQDVLWEDVLLHIARLTDPPKQGQFENLTLRRLPEAVPDQCLADELRNLVDDALDRSQFARQRRNKHLAHRDLSLAIDGKATPLPGVSRQQVEEALSCFRSILNRLHVSYLDEEVAYEYFLANEDGNALVHHLEVGRKGSETVLEINCYDPVFTEEQMNRTLSSPLTFLYKSVFSLLFAAVFLCCAFTSVKLMGDPMALPAALLGGALFLGMFIHLASLKKVALRDRSLVVSGFMRSQTVPLSAITSVRGSTLFSHHPIWVRFRSDTGKEKRIVFMPHMLFIFFREHPVAEELRGLIEQNCQQEGRDQMR